MIRFQRLAMIAVAGLLPTFPVWGGRAAEQASHDFRVFVIDPSVHQISLHWKNRQGQPYRSLKSLKLALDREGHRVVAVMNAGIYDKKYRPLGLHIEQGSVLRPLDRRRGSGNFYLKPNGVFYVDSKGAAIVRTADFKLTSDIVLATQSGPLLFDKKGFHPAFVKNSKYRHYRNAVGVREDGNVVFAMSTKPVTFWQLAHFLRHEEHCTTGIYMDGFISQLWSEGQKGPGGGFPFVGMLAITERKK
jgi:uncharacterized protein YigE (DUF2233 family)